MRILVTFVMTLLLLCLAAAAFVWSGVYNVAADVPHTALVHNALETLRERSIHARSDGIEVPDLDDPALIRSGAGNYEAMCVQCHLRPGLDATELSSGLHPAPPELAEHGIDDPAEAFWVVKHGIKSTAMPAWGHSMDDRYIWGMVAFARTLPRMTAAAYAAEVAASGGHSHGGGEDDAGSGHGHDEGGGPAQSDAPDDGHGHDEAAADSAVGHHDRDAPAAAAHQPHGSADTSTPVAAATALHEALASGETSHVEALLDPDVLILESGGAERSRAEYAAHHMHSDMAFLGSARYELLRQTGDSAGDMAWVASEATIRGGTDDKPVAVRSAETLVLRKHSDGWRIVHVHWSSRPDKS